MRRMTNLGVISREERDTAFDDWLPGDQDDEWPNGPAIGPPETTTCVGLVAPDKPELVQVTKQRIH